MHRSPFIFLLLLFFLVGDLAGQRPLPEFGETDLSALQLEACPFEKDAPAMKLFDIQKVEYDNSLFGGNVTVTRRVRIKIFNEKGFSHATVQIPFFGAGSSSRVSNLRGMIYNLEPGGQAKIRTLSQSEFYRDTVTKYFETVKFTFPELRQGSVIEYTYSVVEKQKLFIDHWLIQSELPTAHALLMIKVPPKSILQYTMFGKDSRLFEAEKLKQDFDGTYYRYSADSIPGFEPEPYMSSTMDYLLRMLFVFIPKSDEMEIPKVNSTLWKVMAGNIARSAWFDGQIQKTIPETESITDSALRIPDIKERIRYLYNVVRRQIPEKTFQKAFPGNIITAWKRRQGSSADINMILLNFLRKAAVPCHPVLVSTRSNGKINIDWPSFGQFDGLNVLAENGNERFLIDASLKYQSFDIPPLNVLNRRALLLHSEKIEWIVVNDERSLYKENTDIKGRITDAGLLEGVSTMQFQHFAKAVVLDSLADASSPAQFLEKRYPGLRIKQVHSKNQDNDNPLWLEVQFSSEPLQTGQFLFIRPAALDALKKNPFTKPTRFTDLDFPCKTEQRFKLQLELPVNCEIEFLPGDTVITSADSSLLFGRMTAVETTGITYSQLFKLKRVNFTKEEYPSIYAFYKSMYALLQQEFIFKRK